MFELFQMWALVEVLGLLCLPLTITVFQNLPDRGWAFNKALGMALFAFGIWIPLMWLHFLPFSRMLIAAGALIFLVCGLLGWLRTRHAILKVVRLNIPYIVATEAVFLGMVFLLGWLRTYGPAIRSFEMFMDEGFIAAIMRSPHLPPNDMWFAGAGINYYYYAHFTLAVLAKLLGQSPSIAFNTGISIFFGLTAVNLFGVTCNIVAWARHMRTRAKFSAEAELEQPHQVHPSLLAAIPYGLLTMVMGLVLGNLAATQQWWLNHGEAAHFDWFLPSRVIDKTINEFPAFSFLLSCFHAHVLALAFTILAIGLAFNLFLEPDGKGLSVFGHGWRLPCTLGTTALVIGSLFTMNGWDYPTYMGLTLVCIALQQWLAYQARFSLAVVLDILSASLSLVALSFILYIPFYLNFTSPAQGIGIVGAADRSLLSGELLIYGLFAFVFLSLLIVSALKRPLGEGILPEHLRGVSLQRVSLFCILGLLLVDILLLRFMPNSLSFVVMGSVALIAIVLMFYHLGDRAHAFTLLLGALAFALVAGCEVIFLKDVFVSTYPRMNTVFKFYFQAWALLAIASGCGMFFLLESFLPRFFARRSNDQREVVPTQQPQRIIAVWLWTWRGVWALWAILFLLLVLSSIIYPLLAPASRFARVDPKMQHFYLQRSNNLDGLTYLQSCGPPECLYDTNGDYAAGDYAAIRWLNEHVQGDPVIVEAIGDQANQGGDYSFYGRVSALTGLPTLIGWVGHEYQWRVNWLNKGSNSVDFDRRSLDVDAIYTDADPTLVTSLMARYHAQYLYVGPLEYLRYPQANLQRFKTFMRVAYNADGVTIYQVIAH